MNKTYVLYHASCSDGSAAAYAAWLKYQESATYLAVQYGRPVPELDAGSDVFVLDFSYDRKTMLSMADRSRNIVVLDHHETAEEALKGLPFAKFDMNRSGAGLAWDYFHPGVEQPKMVDLIQDRDLWRFELEGSRELGACLEDLADFRELDSLRDSTNLQQAIERGKILRGPIDKYLATIHKKAFASLWSGKKVAVINSPVNISEVGELLYENYDIDFAVMFFFKKEDGMVFSLRSNKMNVAQFAQLQNPGGGGHAGAAAFSLPLPDAFARITDLYANRFDLSKLKLHRN